MPHFEEEEDPMNDDHINRLYKAQPGRMTLQLSVFVYLTDIKNFKSTVIPVSFEAYMFDKKCYLRSDPAFQPLQKGEIDNFRTMLAKTDARLHNNKSFRDAITLFSEWNRQNNTQMTQVMMMQLRHRLSEDLMIDVLAHEQ